MDLYFPVIKVLALGTISSVVAFMWAPFLLRLLRWHRFGKHIRSSAEAPVFAHLHQKKIGTPTMGGIVIWGTTLALAFAASLVPSGNFVTRSQTWLPLFALAATALVGLVDDFFNVRNIGAGGGGLRMRHRIIIYSIIALVGAWWFYYKLEWNFLHIPFYGNIPIGAWYPIVSLVIVATSHSVNVTDGLDGLAGSVHSLRSLFWRYCLCARQTDLAALCAVIAGASCFLWFNIHPAQFLWRYRRCH